MVGVIIHDGDEDGNILVGHTRSAIAAEFGIDCPRIVKRGLAEYDKRILAVELNAARRQMTDAQMTIVGARIAPDIAARAKERQGTRTDLAATSATSVTEVSRTTDEVAKTVGLGSGRTFERHHQVVEAVQDEPDGPLLFADMERGDMTIREAPPGA